MNHHFFDGRHETVHLENGRSFGIPPRIYQCLAQPAISASELAGIEPQILEHLPGGRRVAVCTLFGAQPFTIQIDIDPPPPIVGLGMCGLDDPTPSLERECDGDARRFATWRGIVECMLRAEGFVGASAEELDQWNAAHGFL
jgi:hypothetical protein